MADKRIDWNSMMVFDKDDTNEMHAAEAKESDHEKAEHPVYFQYLEKTERTQLGPAAEAWHNPMMRVDGRLNAEDAFSSLPHWAWFDDMA